MKKTFFLVFALILANIFSASAQTPNSKSKWGVENTVNVVKADDDHIYLGGFFTEAGKNAARIAKITTSSSTMTDYSMPSVAGGAIRAIVSDGSGGYFIGGSFTSVDGVTRTRLAHILSDGTLDANWNVAINNHVHDLAVDGGYLYVAGEFSGANSVGSQTRNRLAKIAISDATINAWDPNISTGTFAYKIVIDGDYVYVAGGFTEINSTARNRLAKIHKSTGALDAWDPNANSLVFAIAIDGDDVYVGGTFNGATSIGGVTRDRLAKLNKNTGVVDVGWDPGCTGQVNYITLDGTLVYIGGTFFGAASIGGQDRNRIARANKSDGVVDVIWNPNISNAVYDIDVTDDHVYANGEFNGPNSVNGNTVRNCLARFDKIDGTVDSGWDPNLSSTVQKVLISGTDVFVLGNFTRINRITRNRILRLNKSDGELDLTWNPNISNAVNGIAFTNNTVYVGGEFFGANAVNGNITRDYLAAFNKSDGVATAWNPDANSLVNTVEVNGDYVYIGGNFAGANSMNNNTQRNRIARVNLTDGTVDGWDPNASGTVRQFLFEGDNVYIGGSFTEMVGQPRNYLAKVSISTGNLDVDWDPNASSLVYSLASDNNYIYIGGMFNGANSINGDTQRNRIARVNKTNGLVDANWNPNAGNTVYSVVVSGSNVFLGGMFTGANSINGNTTRNYLALVNNTNGNVKDWNPNFDGSILSMFNSEDDLFVVTNGLNVNGIPYNRLAILDLPNNDVTVTTLIGSSVIKTSGNATLQGDITAGENITQRGFVISTSTGAYDTWNSDNSATVTLGSGSTGSFTLEVRNLGGGTHYQYYAYATNADGTGQGSTATFTTDAVTVPTLTTSSEVSAGPNFVSISGEVTDGGGRAIQEYGFVYATTQNPTTANSKAVYGENLALGARTDMKMSSRLSGLNMNTRYYVRSYVTNDAGTFYGNQVSIMTTPTMPEWAAIISIASLGIFGGWWSYRKFVA